MPSTAFNDLPRASLTIALVAKGASAVKEPPTEFRIFKAGENKSDKGTFIFDSAAAEAVMAAYKERGQKRIAIDYEHKSLNPNAPASEQKAAGWFEPELRDGELWGTAATWTPTAAKEIIEGEREFYSPTFRHTKDKKEVRMLVNVGLTNTPSLYGLDQLVAAKSGEAGLSFNDIQDEIREAMRAANPMRYCCICEVWPDRFVYMFDDVGDDEMWQQAYKLEAGKVVLDGDPIKVERRYVPVEQTAAKAVPFKVTPVGKIGDTWSGKKAVAELKAWAKRDGDTVNYDMYAMGFAYVRLNEGETGNPPRLGAYLLPHHDIEDGKLMLHPAGLKAAAAVVQGARGGVDIPEADLKSVKEHLGKHYAQLKLTAPWESTEQTQSRACARESTLMDQTILAALSLKTDAPETEALAAVTGLVASKTKLCALTSKETLNEAMGVVEAWKTSADELPKVQTELASLKTEQRKAAVAKVLDDGKTRVTPAMRVSLLSARPFDKDEDVAWLKAHVEALPLTALGAVAPKEPALSSDTTTMETGGKKWEELQPKEKAALHGSSPETYAALKADFQKRTGKTVGA